MASKTPQTKQGQTPPTKTAATPTKQEPPKETPVTKKEEPKKVATVPTVVPTTTTTTVPTVVPESLLKKRKGDEKTKLSQAARLLAIKAKRRANRKIIFKRAEKYVKEYRNNERSLINLRREAKKKGGFFLEPEAKLALVVRLRGINGIGPKARKILQLLRIRQIGNATLVKLNKASISMLRIIEPYVAYGYPGLKTVRELVYKRGYAKVEKQRIPLSDNSIIERALGKFGIICVEDLVHELYTVGPHFKEANNFLWPFKLSSPKGGFLKKRNHFIE